MVPPVYIGPGPAITRIGLQKTYVFFKDGLETFVIRPGFRGKVDNFGMLIPFPSPPAVRKVPDNIFQQIAAAVDPPEVVIDLWMRFARGGRFALPAAEARGLKFRRKSDSVRVIRQEAVGMYEVAVLEAGSARALARWMDDHGFRYPKGMDAACEDYIDARWCFVAVKTRVGNKGAVDPKAGMRKADPKLPRGSSFDGNVQAMGFRFRVKSLVVPMRLSAFNKGKLRNVVYVLSDQPTRINHIPEKYVVRQISGDELYRNVTDPLPLRIIGGEWKDVPESRKRNLKTLRNPAPHNGLAKALFASDLLALARDRLSHPFEEKEKELLKIGERLGLRGSHLDSLHRKALAKDREAAVKGALAQLRKMTLTVVDGDFPREMLSKENLTFSRFTMDARKNRPQNYDAKLFRAAPSPGGKVYRRTGLLEPREKDRTRMAGVWLPLALPALALGWMAIVNRRFFYGKGV